MDSNSKGNCGELLSKSYIRQVFSPIYDLNTFYRLLRFFQNNARVVANSETAFSTSEYEETALTNPEPLRGHCGAVVWFLQRRFGGRAVLKQYVAENGEKDSNNQVREVWHMHNEGVAIRTGDSVHFVGLDLTKTQFSSEVDDLLPISKNEIVYEGIRFIHRPGIEMEDLDYRWDQDKLNPPRVELETFLVRVETGQNISLEF